MSVPLRSRPAVPPVALVMLAVGSVQLGSAVARHDLFARLHPGGAALLRVAFGAIILVALMRPRTAGRSRRDILTALLFGVVIASMNFSFYLALNRVPLGVAVTLEFIGPLGVAVAGSRRAIDGLWVALAAAGILLLAPWGAFHLDLLGAVFALLAGSFWASYIYLSQRVGRLFPGGAGLALGMVGGGVVLLPVGIIAAGTALLQPRLLLGGLAVAILSSVVPYSLEMEALRHLHTRVFGVLMSSEPAVAAVFGFLILRQVLDVRAIIAILLVSAATLGASRERGPEDPVEVDV